MRDDAADFDPETLDWERLETLRDGFLEGSRGGARGGGHGGAFAGSYWRDAADVELYDCTFGRRIAWKWSAVLDELAARGFVLPAGRWLDWGAGSAIATREVLRRSAESLRPHVTLFDRSSVALEYAREALAVERAGLSIDVTNRADAIATSGFDLVLVSHVMSELSPRELGDLVALLSTARAFVWVDAATRDESRALSAVRERLLEVHDPVAPCPHREACGVLAAGRERDWCHFFATPPARVFTASEWGHFGRRLGVDLRSLPYSFLAMRSRAAERTEPVPSTASRLLGRARVERAALHVECCEAEGVRERRLLRRRDGNLFKRLSENRHAPKLVRWRLEGEELVGIDEELA
ncbi:MAG: small ribosomal subunit Rsm22 family protein [Planctomycetes bacterium]|nr:small ribosomal subunit Rsm22 family protein [Planctomycetota bacterium]